MLQIHITIVGRRGKPRLRAGIMLCSHMRNPLPRIASQGFLSWHDNLPPVLSVSESCLWLLCLLVLICLSFRWLIQRQRLQRLKGMNSSLPFFDPSIGEIVAPGCLTHHEIRCTIYWFSKTFFFFCSKQYCIKWFSSVKNESCKTYKRKQSDPKHIYPQPLCLGNSGHMVCKWCLQILAKSTHDGIN